MKRSGDATMERWVDSMESVSRSTLGLRYTVAPTLRQDPKILARAARLESTAGGKRRTDESVNSHRGLVTRRSFEVAYDTTTEIAAV